MYNVVSGSTTKISSECIFHHNVSRIRDRERRRIHPFPGQILQCAAICLEVAEAELGELRSL